MGGTKPWPELKVANKDHTSAAVVIIGAGISGMCTAINLLKNNIHNFIILERSSSFGGTWHDNRYPGCCCDIHSHLYSFSFDQNPDWTREYPGQEEILEYLLRVASKYNLYRHIRFNTSVAKATWNDTNAQWVTDVKIASNSKDAEFQGSDYTITSDFLVSAVGQLNTPRYPDIPGLEDFKGKVMHSARWDWTYDLSNKRIAMIGNGATSCQLAPELAKTASHLTIHQRTPAWIVPRMDAEVGPWSRTLQRYFPPFLYRLRAGYMDFHESGFEAIVKPKSEMAQAFKDMCLNMMHTALPGREDMWEKLTPKYSVGCKRILISDDYYLCLARSNVTLETKPIERIAERGVVLQGQDTESINEIDLLVLATGFRATQFMHPIEIIGANGMPLREIWSDGAIAYNGVTVPNLPNFGMLYGPNTNLGHNSIILMIEAQSKYIAAMAGAVLEARMRDGTGSNQGQRREGSQGRENRIALCPKREVVGEYNEEIQARLKDSSFNDPACGSWYKDPKTGKITNNWAGTVIEYQERMSSISWDDFEDGENVVRMRNGQKEVSLPRVREESYFSDRTLAGLMAAVVVAAGAAGWVLRQQRVLGRVRA